MSNSIEKLANIIELIKNKKKKDALAEYKKYSKMPHKSSEKYIEQLQYKILKGEVDIGNISDEEIELFNRAPNEDELILKKKETRKNLLIIGGVILVVFIFAMSDKNSNENQNKNSDSSMVSTENYSCDQSGAYDFAVHRIESIIGELHFLDYNGMIGDDWLFVGYVTTYEHNYSSSFELLVGCSSKESYFVKNANFY